MMLAWMAAASAAPATTEALDLELQRRRRSGTWLTVGGLAAVAGGVSVMTIGRGKPGELSEETLLVSDVRSLSGGLLLIGGITTAIVGANHLAEARAIRREQGLALSVTPSRLALVGWF
jgi:hypothetical protein